MTMKNIVAVDLKPLAGIASNANSLKPMMWLSKDQSAIILDSGVEEAIEKLHIFAILLYRRFNR
jgi:hypothetical protein